MLPTILCLALRAEAAGGAKNDLFVYAMTEDGELLFSTVVSARHGIERARRAAGFGPKLADTTATARYERRFPDGYEAEWIDDPENDPRAVLALKLHKALGEEGDKRL